MLRSFKALNGFAIRATDGRIGRVRDVYFDDRNWRVRYCVADSDRWFAEHVLVGQRSLSVSDTVRRELWVRLSKAEVKRSRSAKSDQPVSKQRRAGVMASLRRLSPWTAAGRSGPPAAPPDAHLRSCKAVIGHQLEAVDGVIGRVDDLLIDDKAWVVRQLVIDPGHDNVPAAARVLVELKSVDGISWPDARVSVGLTRVDVLSAPRYEPVSVATALPLLPM